MYDTLIAAGALLGALAFGWDAWSYFAERRRRQWADDLRELLLRVQPVTTEMSRKPRVEPWLKDNGVMSLVAELRALEERMRGVQGIRVGLLAGQLSRCDSEKYGIANEGHEGALAAADQVRVAKEAHALVLALLRRV